jgi:hypothetical protein
MGIRLEKGMEQEDEAESVSSEQSLRGGVVPRYYILMAQALMLAHGHVMTWYIMVRHGHGHGPGSSPHTPPGRIRRGHRSLSIITIVTEYRVSLLGTNQEPPRKRKEKKRVKKLCFLLLLHKPLIPRGINVKTPEGVSKCWGTQRSRTMQLQQLGERVSRWGRAL